jgi:hypothetical protein
MEKNVSLPSNGGLAHLARALAWQARGGRFESDILHKKTQLFKELRFLLSICKIISMKEMFFFICSKINSF